MTDILRTLTELDEKVPDWRKITLSMYDQGASDREIMKEIGLSPGAFTALYNDLELDFKAIIDYGRLLSHAWWESLGRKHLENPKFQTALYKFNMSNRFGWTEKSEQSLTNVEHKNFDDGALKREIDDLLAQLEEGRGKG